MMLKTFELSLVGSNRVAVAMAKSREEAERLAKINSPNANGLLSRRCSGERISRSILRRSPPTGDSLCERNHPYDKVAL